MPQIVKQAKRHTLIHARDVFHAQPFYFVGPRGGVSIDPLRLVRFIEACGVGRYYEAPHSWFYVHEHGAIVERAEEADIRAFVRRFLESLEDRPFEDGVRPVEILEKYLRAPGRYLGRDKLELLHPRRLSFIKGDDDAAFFYYENTVVMVTAHRVLPLPYETFPGNVWAEHIIPRKFEPRSGEPLHGHDWPKHLRLITGGEDTRYLSLCAALGYLMHRYKDPSVTKAVILMDEAVSTSTEGRTGKSVTLQSLRHIVNSISWEARRFNLFDRFAWQDIEPQIDVVDFNDASPSFPFDILFPMLTGDMTRERKGENRITIPFADVPKVCISTNYAIQGSGASFEARSHVVELAPAYSEDRTPVDVFGRRFFSDWTQEDWNIFDNVMMQCVQLYLHSGLVEYQRRSLHFKKLVAAVSDDDLFQNNESFARFALAYPEGRHDSTDVLRHFREEYPMREFIHELTQTRFTQWMNAFFDEYRCGSVYRSGGFTKYHIKDTSESRARLAPEDIPIDQGTIDEDAPIPGAAGLPAHELNGNRETGHMTQAEWLKMTDRRTQLGHIRRGLEPEEQPDEAARRRMQTDAFDDVEGGDAPF